MMDPSDAAFEYFECDPLNKLIASSGCDLFG